MTIPRSEQIDLDATPFYHIMTRCVRRSYLCGVDKLTGKDYSHRKYWLVNKFKALADIFAINIAAYAVMTNHYHLVLHVNEEQAKNWSHDDIKKRWAMIFPKDAKKTRIQEKNGYSPALLKQKYEVWRERLSSISWFMRCINEPIARLSNEEDECTGRFWEGRFKSQALLDEGALLSAMAYVDLNPIRAGVASTPETSEFTSIHERIQYIKNQTIPKKNKHKNINVRDVIQNDADFVQPPQLMRFATDYSKINSILPTIDFALVDYLELVDATGRMVRADKRGYIPSHLNPILERLNFDEESWMTMVNELENGFSCFVGQAQLQSLFDRVERKAKFAQEKITA